ncbi:hypothetical protein GP486_006794 [Trichoglossum hirsutum]|uniref:Uncharacterized protein n=1 Tax=Trichoglossum hirsutum TaxID=265104 RepID=A0A9P8IDW2_9PEZI|nr:hypothetical protein GP486_006794 [Trichoglossum hirsutum]
MSYTAWSGHAKRSGRLKQSVRSKRRSVQTDSLNCRANLAKVELGILRNPRYPLGTPYIKEYWKHIPPSQPQDDAESRLTMYMIRNQVSLASIYPMDPTLRNM